MANRKRKGRPVNGILLLDKPSGVTSNKILQIVKRLFNAQKAGHTGSLDPFATGLLPICFGEATKVSGFMLNADKSYEAICKLGVKTDSADIDGNVIEERAVPALTETGVKAVLETFLGEIEQLPPMHSALKKDGVPLYKLAHQGITIERETRFVTIHSLELTRIDAEFLHIKVKCSKGTYIRTLVDDIGEKLGCGAHLVNLHRTKVGSFDASDMHTLPELEELEAQKKGLLDGTLQSIDTALSQWPLVNLTSDATFYIRQGQSVFVPKVPGHGWVRLYKDDGGFLGIGEIKDDGKIAPKRLMDMA